MIYSFIDTETEEEFEVEMTYDQLKAFLEFNPRFNQTFRMNIVDPVGIGITKPYLIAYSDMMMFPWKNNYIITYEWGYL